MSIIEQIYIIPEEDISNVKNIDVFQTVTSVSFEVEPNTNVININKVTSEGGSATNLSTTQTASNFTINSDTGDDALVPLGNGTLAGATLNDYTTAEKNKLAAITGTNTGDQNLQSVTDIGATTTNGIYINGITNDYGLVIQTNSNNYPSIYVDNAGSGINANGIEVNSLEGIATNIYSQNGVGIRAQSISGIPIEVYGNGNNTPSIDVNLGNTNKGVVIDSGTSSTGNPIEVNKNGVNKLTVNQQGELTATKLIKQGGTSTQFLMADGSVSTGGSGIPHTTASGTDTYTATVSGVTSYADGDIYLVRFPIGNTTGCTLNINALGAIPLYKNNDGALIGGDIQNSGEMLCVYDSVSAVFRCIGTSPNSIIAYVTNADSVTITKGQAVYAFGGQGDRMTVKRAFNTSDATSGQTIGIVMSTSIATNQRGIIMMQGLLDGLDTLPTGTYADGDTVYLGATAGTITNVKPHAPNHLVYLGVVTTASNGASGRMYVKVQNGYELDELHNVQAQNPTLKDTLWYDNTVTPAQWKTASIPTILGYTPANDANVVHLTGNETISGTKTFGSNIVIPATGTALILSSSSGGTVSGLTTTTYPDLTELSYVKGVTSAIQNQLNGKVSTNTAITGATKTKITYDSKGLVTSGADATTADIADSNNKRYVTDANLTVIGNTSGTNTGDQDISNLVVKNANITPATNTKITYDAKGLVTAGTTLIESDIPTLSQSKVTNLTTDLAGKILKNIATTYTTNTITTVTDAEYAAIVTKDATTLYFII